MSLAYVLHKAKEQRVLLDVSLELTYNCNLDCFYCYNDREKKGELLSLHNYEVLLADLAEMQTMHLMLTGGEPMVHPHFFDIGKIAKELGFVVRVRTNGHSLNQRIAKRLQDEVDPYLVEISLHGATADVHDRQTRVDGSFDRLIANIKEAKNLGLRINAVCTPTAWNEHQITELFDLCDELGVLLRFQGPVGPRDNGDTEPLVIQPKPSVWGTIKQIQTERYEKEMGVNKKKPEQTDADKKPKITATCSVGRSAVDIDPFGNVQACMHFKKAAGNVSEQSIKDIWNHSQLFIEARQRAIDAAKHFQNTPVQQFGAPVYCIAVEENCEKGCAGCGS